MMVNDTTNICILIDFNLSLHQINTIMTEERLDLYTNLFFFFVFIPLMTLLVPTERWAETRPALLMSIIGYLIISFLALTQVNIPGLFMHRHFVKGSAYMAAALLITVGFSRFANWLNLYERIGNVSRPSSVESTVWFLFLVILGYSFFNNMLKESARLASAREEIEAQRDKAELAMYRAQVNPHFLFNTLNTLYGLILTDSDKREEAFEKFINMCKYTYKNANRDYISMGEEIDYLKEYVDLQLFRIGDMTKVETNYQVDDENVSIAPMLLINYVENAFKYGISSTDNCLIKIDLTVRKGVLHFMVYNSHINKKAKVSSRNGLANSRHRLELLYPEGYFLHHRADKDGYTVKLMINLKRTS